MFELTFRIKHIPSDGYFPQVKHGFFSRWKTIIDKDGDFTLASEGYELKPYETHYDAVLYCHAYKGRFKRNQNKTTYVGL
jgi:hypothetical protein